MSRRKPRHTLTDIASDLLAFAMFVALGAVLAAHAVAYTAAQGGI